jgi:hypothetical protein
MEEQKQVGKMSYEQLENIAHQLSIQNQDLHKRLNEANLINVFKRLDYLFKVVENSDKFNTDFVNLCINEIEGLLTINEEEVNVDSSCKEES